MKTDVIRKTVKNVYDAIDLDVQEVSGYYESIAKDNDDQEAIKSYRIKVHSIKSTATVLGILPIAGMAATLEYAARDGKIDKILAMTPYLLSDLSGYKEKLSGVIKVDLAGEKKEITDKNVC